MLKKLANLVSSYTPFKQMRGAIKLMLYFLVCKMSANCCFYSDEFDEFQPHMFSPTELMQKAKYLIFHSCSLL